MPSHDRLKFCQSISKTLSESIGYKQVFFHYKPMGDRPPEARARWVTGYNG
jgi:hypothetical protein